MDLGLSEEQELLKNSAREFLEKECPEEHVRAMEEDDKGYSPALWKKMADLGWQGLMIPEEYGGAGFSFLDLCVLVEEFGRALVPGPFIPNADGNGDAHPRRHRRAEEEVPAEDRGRHGHPHVRDHGAKRPLGPRRLRNEGDGERQRLRAQRHEAVRARCARGRLPARRSRGNPNGGLSTFIVPRDQPGITITVLKTIASDKQAEVVFKDVKVAASDVVKMDAATGDRLRNIATCLECAYLVGLAQRDFEISVNYAKERVQFGRPIGSFQAIQHKAADMVTDVDGMRFIMYKAAWATSENEASADMDTAMAKAWCSDASRRVVAHGQQIHGGIGFTKDYIIQLFFRRQKRAELFWGDGDFHRERVAQMLEI